jgi:RNA polymerase sigma factor (sigma-70 family)
MESQGDRWQRQLVSFAEQTRHAFTVALRASGDPVVAEEAVQETCARLVAKPPADLTGRNPLGYFLKAVRTTTLELQRSGRRRRRREEVHAMAARNTASAPDEAAARSEEALAARTALEGLGSEEREAVSLIYEQNLKRKTAARILGCPERTVAYRAMRGLEKIKRELTAKGFAASGAVAIGNGLREMGMLEPPARLVTNIGRMVTGPGGEVLRKISVARVSTRSRPMKPAAAPSLAPAVVVLGVLAVAGGFWWMQTDDATRARPVTPVTPDKTKQAPLKDPIIARWTFEDGPVEGIRVLKGDWTWKRKHEGASGVMLATRPTHLLLPTKVPAEPFVVETKMIPWGDAELYRQFGCKLVDLKDAPCGKIWLRGWGKKRYFPKGSTSRLYFTGKWGFGYINDEIYTVFEYEREFPANRVFLHFNRWAVDEICIRRISPDELPDLARDPEKAKARMDMGPEESARLLKEYSDRLKARDKKRRRQKKPIKK